MKKLLIISLIFISSFSISLAGNSPDMTKDNTMIEFVKDLYEPEDIYVDGDIVSLYIYFEFPSSSEADRLDDLDDRIRLNFFLDDYPSSSEVDNFNRISQGGRLLFRSESSSSSIGYPSSSEIDDLNDLNSDFSIFILNLYYPDDDEVDDLNDLDRGIEMVVSSSYYPDDTDTDNLNDLDGHHDIRLNLDGYPPTYYYVEELNDINRDIDLLMFDDSVPSTVDLSLINEIDESHNLQNDIYYYPSEWEVDYILNEFDDDIILYITNYNWPNDDKSDILKELDSRHKLEIYGDTYPDNDDIDELNDIGRAIDVNIIADDYPSSSEALRLNDVRANSHIEIVVDDYFSYDEMEDLLEITHEYDLSIYEYGIPSTSQVEDLNEYIQRRFADVNDAELISHTIPDKVLANDSFNVSATFKNTGTTTWSSSEAYKLGAYGDSDPFGPARVALPNDIEPGEEVTFTFPFNIPDQEGNYTTDWRMVEEYIEWFGDTILVNVEVLYNKMFSFDTGSEGWYTITYPQVLSPTSFSVGNGALAITANNNVDNFGIWQSAFNYGADDAIPLKEGLMYRASFNISTNIQYQDQVPQTRLRWGCADGQLNGIVAYNSITGSESSPTPSGKDYEFYFSLMNHSYSADPNLNYLVTAFEMYNFLSDDSTNGTIFLNRIDITGIEPSELTNFEEVKRYTFDTSDEGWVFYSQSPFTAPIPSWDQTNSSIVLTAQDNTNTFGYYFSPFEVIIEANKLYRIRFTVKNFTPLLDQTPTYRLRISAENGQIDTITSISSVTGSEAIADINGKTYEVYIDPPQSAIGSSYPHLVFSFDMLNFFTDDDPNGSVGLDEVIIEKFDRPDLP